MVRVPFLVAIAIIVIGLLGIVSGSTGLTFQWKCEEYAAEKAIEAYKEGYRPYDSYSFIGLGVGFCEPAYSNE